MRIRHIIPASVDAEQRRMHLANLRQARFLAHMRMVAHAAAGDVRAWLFCGCLLVKLDERIEAWKAVQL